MKPGPYRCGCNGAERWLPVPSAPGYEASDRGRVRSVDRIVVRTDGVRARYPSRIRTICRWKDGRHYVNLPGGTRRVHLLVLEAFVGPRPMGMEGCHRDDDQSNNALSNLRWDTPRENKLDVVRNGNHELVNRECCPRRHALVEPNLVISKLRTRRRQCLACHRAQGYLRNHPELRDQFEATADHYYDSIMGAAA